MNICNNQLLKNKTLTTALPFLEGVKLFCTNKEKKNEAFKNKKNAVFTINPSVQIISSIIQMGLLLVALYFSFKCNKGFNLGSVLLACCCPICYTAYRLAIPCVQK